VSLAARSKQRILGIKYSLWLSFLNKVLSSGSAWLTTPFLIVSLGSERFGIWSALASVILLENLTDFGLGNSLINAVATARGLVQDQKIRWLVSFVQRKLLLFSAILSLLLLCISLVDISSFLTFIRPDDSQARLTVLLVFASVIIATPLSVVEKVEAGYQKYHYLWASQILANGITLSLIGFCALGKIRPDLISVALMFLIPMLLVKSLNWLYFFCLLVPNARPNFTLPIKLSELEQRGLMATSLQFFALQWLYILGFSFDTLLVGNFLGGAQVATYSCALFYCNAAGILARLASQSLWSVYSEAIASNDLAWCRLALLRSTLMGLLVTLFGCIILHLAEPILLPRFAPGLPISPELLLAGYVGALLDAFQFNLNTFLNGAARLRFLLTSHTIFLFLATPLKILVLVKGSLHAFLWSKFCLTICLMVLPGSLIVWGILNEKKEAHA